MKPTDVSVMVVNFTNDELYVNVTFKINGNLLGIGSSKVIEETRRDKAKEIRKILEAVEFSNDKTPTLNNQYQYHYQNHTKLGVTKT